MGGRPSSRAEVRFRTGLTRAQRLRRIAEIIEAVDNRCMAADGPVTPTLHEMTPSEIREIYRLASTETRHD